MKHNYARLCSVFASYYLIVEHFLDIMELLHAQPL
jgi:hypothetical protein